MHTLTITDLGEKRYEGADVEAAAVEAAVSRGASLATLRGYLRTDGSPATTRISVTPSRIRAMRLGVQS